MAKDVKVVEGNFKKKRVEERIKFPELCDSFCAIISGEAHPFAASWPHRFRVFEPTIGSKVPVMVSDDNILKIVPLGYVVNCLVAWARELRNADWLLTEDKAQQVAKTWRAMAEPIPEAEIKPLRWAGDMGYTWQRLPWVRDSSGKAPTWNKILARMSNEKAFCAWIGSIFFEDSDLQQYCFVHGKGSDGKGAVNRFLSEVFGGAYCSKQPPDSNLRFWAYEIIAKRLVVFPDCNSRQFMTGGLFKSMTGGDPVGVEAKREMSFTTKLNAKYLFLSNERPGLSSEESDRRRIVYCEMTAREDTTPEPGFEQKLWEEGGTFISICMDYYEKHYQDRGPIKTETDEIDDHIALVELRFSAIFERNFNVCTDRNQWPTGAEVWEIVRREYQERREREDFLKWMERKGIRRLTTRVGEQRTQLYQGISVKVSARLF